MNERRIISMARKRSQSKYLNRHDPVDRSRHPGTLFVVGSPIGSPDDITIRALSILKRVSVIAAESPLCTQTLLHHHGIFQRITSYGPRHQREKIAVLLQLLNQGQDIALVSDSGMPVLYDPGQLLIAAAHRTGIPVSVIPGPSALTAALAASGYSGDRILFEGHAPQKGRELTKFFMQFKREHRTIVVFVSAPCLPLALHKIVDILGNRRVTVAINLTKAGETVYRGRLLSVMRQMPPLSHDSEITLVIEGRNRPRQAKEQKAGKGRYPSSARRRITTR